MFATAGPKLYFDSSSAYGQYYCKATGQEIPAVVLWIVAESKLVDNQD